MNAFTYDSAAGHWIDQRREWLIELVATDTQELCEACSTDSCLCSDVIELAKRNDVADRHAAIVQSVRKHYAQDLMRRAEKDYEAQLVEWAFEGSEARAA